MNWAIVMWDLNMFFAWVMILVFHTLDKMNPSLLYLVLSGFYAGAFCSYGYETVIYGIPGQ